MFTRLGLRPKLPGGAVPDKVSGRVAITRTWSLVLPGAFERTIGHGLLEFTKRAMVVRVTAYANPETSEDVLLDRIYAGLTGASHVERRQRDDGSAWLIYETRESTFGGLARLTVVHAHASLEREYVGLEIGAKDRIGLGSAYGIIESCARATRT